MTSTSTTSSVITSYERPAGNPTKVSLNSASMNKPYSATSFKAEWALEQGSRRTAITAKGLDNWWKA
jgi:hypothetical protein